MNQRSQRRMQQIKREVAAEAARIMATEGQRNYLAAKQKAADRLGVFNRLALPSNIDVEEALKTYLELYGGPERNAFLADMRKAALDAMKFLERYEPKLVGTVLDGTADRHSRISLHLFSETPDEITLFLSERGIAFREEERRIRWHDGSFRTLPVLATEAGSNTVELCLFRSLDQRQAPPSPVDGKPQRRASISEVEVLVDQADSEPALVNSTSDC